MLLLNVMMVESEQEEGENCFMYQADEIEGKTTATTFNSALALGENGSVVPNGCEKMSPRKLHTSCTSAIRF
jgi:hypothetical protein